MRINIARATEDDLSSLDKEASFLPFMWALCVSVYETWNGCQTAVCVAAGYSLIAASLADMFPSTC